MPEINIKSIASLKLINQQLWNNLMNMEIVGYISILFSMILGYYDNYHLIGILFFIGGLAVILHHQRKKK